MIIITATIIIKIKENELIVALWQYMVSEILVSTGSGNDRNTCQHKAITWTNDDSPSTKCPVIHPRVMFSSILKISIPRLCFQIYTFDFKFTHMKSQPRLPGDNRVHHYHFILMTGGVGGG